MTTTGLKSNFLLGSLGEKYHELMALGDERILKYPLMDSPLPTITMCIIYLVFVKFIGPNFMANRKAYDLRYAMILYNFSLVILNGYLFWKFGVHGWFGKYNFRCQPVDTSNSIDGLAMVFTGWLFYISKFIEFLDTIFFVLRKKDNQITALHLVHHATMPFNVWFTIRFAPGGHSSFCSIINSAVHVVMYLYYGLSAIGPHMNKYLFWKKYITKMQLTQFVLVVIHSGQLFFRQCNYPKFFMVYIGFYSILFFIMFSGFYKSAYSDKKQSTRDINKCNNQFTNSFTHDTSNENILNTAKKLI